MATVLSRIAQISLLATLAPTTIDGQCHGQGLSKTTYAGSANAQFTALDFMVKVLGMIPADDSAPGNAEQCPEGSSGVSTPWVITMQRGETVSTNYEVGACTLHYGPTLAVPVDSVISRGNAHQSTSDSRSSKLSSKSIANKENRERMPDHEDVATFDAKTWTGPAALWKPLVAGMDCTYSTATHANALAPLHDTRVADNESIGTIDMNIFAPLTVAARSPDTCCKSCTADLDCIAAAFVPSPKNLPSNGTTPPPVPSPSLATQQQQHYLSPAQSSLNSTPLLPQFPPRHSGPGPQPGECFGVHVTSVPGHADDATPGLSVEVVESHFDSKLAGMQSFDWFLDYNVAFFTPSLDALLTKLDAQKVPWLAAQWPAPKEHEGDTSEIYEAGEILSSSAATTTTASSDTPSSRRQNSDVSGIKNNIRSNSGTNNGGRIPSRSDNSRNNKSSSSSSSISRNSSNSSSSSRNNSGNKNNSGSSVALNAPSSGYSVFVHVTGAQLVVEFIAVKSERLSLLQDQTANESNNDAHVEEWRSSAHPLGPLMPLEPRMTYAAWHEHAILGFNSAHASSNSNSGGSSSSRGNEHVGPQYGLTAISVSRAISSRALLNATEAFYAEGAKCSCTMAINAWRANDRIKSPANNTKKTTSTRAAGVKVSLPTLLLWKRCFRWPGSFSDVCFTTYEATEGRHERSMAKKNVASNSERTGAAGASWSHLLDSSSSTTTSSPSSLAASLLTAGSFTPLAFESMLATSHEKWLRGKPACGMDRWVDNHYAIDLGPNKFAAPIIPYGSSIFKKTGSRSTSSFPPKSSKGASEARAVETSSSSRSRIISPMTVADSAIEIGKETEEKSPYDYYDVGPLLEYVLTKGFLYTCGGGPHGNPAKGVHYVVDPTGWGVQLDVPMETARTMPGCENPHQVGDNAGSPGPLAWCRGNRAACGSSSSLSSPALTEASHPSHSSSTQPMSLGSHSVGVHASPANQPKTTEDNQPLPPSAAPSLFTTKPGSALAETADAAAAGSSFIDDVGPNINAKMGKGIIDTPQKGFAARWTHLWQKAQFLGASVLKAALFLCVFSVVMLLYFECRDQGSNGVGGSYFGGELMRPSRFLATNQHALRGGSYELVAQVQEEEEGDDSELGVQGKIH